jgi:eukaryotic-like serine/threonine-protein kinase
MNNRPFQLLMMISIMLIVSLACSLGSVELFGSSEQPRETAPAAEDTIPEMVFQDEMPAAEQIPTNTPTANPTNTPMAEPSLGIGSTIVNPVDGAVMVYVPAGEFLMGSEDEDAWDEEKPEHLVYLDAYWIYKHEVTNQQYRQCVDANACKEPRSTANYNNSSYKNHPVVYVSWDDADAYCQWVGGRLPTEAEWEKAARGTDGRTYPWGDDNPTCNLANHSACEGGTTPVGSYPDGASPYGALDMAGNVWEWVADWYEEDYYSRSPYENPQGPTRWIYRVHRGGSWNSNERNLWVSYRHRNNPDFRGYHYGFRCVCSP